MGRIAPLGCSDQVEKPDETWSFQRGDTTGVRLEHVRLSGPTIQQRILSRNSSALRKVRQPLIVGQTY